MRLGAILLILCSALAMAQGGMMPGPGTVHSAAAGCSTSTCGSLTFKQGCNNVNTGTTVTCSFAALTNPSILIVTGGNANAATLTASGCGFTWTNRGTFNSSPSWMQATAPNTGTSTCVVTMTSTVSAFISIEGVELSGSVANLVDVANLVNAGNVTAGNNISGTSITTTVANDVVVQSTHGYSTTGDVYTAGSGTIIYQGTANGIGFAFQWQSQVATGSVNPTIKSNTTDFFIVGNLAVEP